MEEVWKDISLSCLHSPLNPNPSTLHHGMLLQDFLDRLRTHHQPTLKPSSAAVDSATQERPPATSLSLSHNQLGSSVVGDGGNDGDHHCFGRPVSRLPTIGSSSSAAVASARRTVVPSFLSGLSSPFEEALASPPPSSSSSPAAAPLLNPFCRKRDSEKSDRAGDRRYKRMMKNRESAARSRARRQAYSFALERERSLLIEENTRLKRKLQGRESSSCAVVPPPAAAAPQPPLKNRRLLRSHSASF